MFGNDIAYTTTIHEMDKLFLAAKHNESSIIPWIVGNFKSYFDIKKWIEENGINFSIERELGLDMDCPECGAPDSLCKERFDEFLILEFTDAGYGAVHHLTVAAYMVQHSSKMTREGWLFERNLLKEFLVENKSPEFIRKQNRDVVDSGKRKFKIKSKTGIPVINKTAWAKTILDVRSENSEVYCEDIIAWARSVLEEAEAVKV